MITINQTPPKRVGAYGIPVIDGVRYKRASGFAMDDKSALKRWGQGMAARGVALDDTLRNAILTLDTQSPTYKSELYKLGAKAVDVAGGDKAASDGTSIHRATEMHDHGQDTTFLPAPIRAAVASYQQLLDQHHLIPLVAEVFVVCPALTVAGTLDRLVVNTDTRQVHVLDLKTGSASAARYSGLSWATQVAIYAHADPWCADRGYMTWESLGLIEPNADTGLVAHVPQDDPDAAQLWTVDLDAGWQAALTARDVHTQRATTYLTAAVAGAGNTNTSRKENAA